MPVYEYGCEKCGVEFEREQRITDEPVKSCPECRSRKVKRLISRTSFVLKGGGWYSDLYSSADAKKKSEGEKDGGAKSDAKGDAKSDSKDKGKDKGKDPGSKGKKKGKGSKAAA